MSLKSQSEKQEAKKYYKWLKLKTIPEIAVIHNISQERIIYLLKKYYPFLKH